MKAFSLHHGDALGAMAAPAAPPRGGSRLRVQGEALPGSGSTVARAEPEEAPVAAGLAALHRASRPRLSGFLSGPGDRNHQEDVAMTVRLQHHKGHAATSLEGEEEENAGDTEGGRSGQEENADANSSKEEAVQEVVADGEKKWDVEEMKENVGNILKKIKEGWKECQKNKICKDLHDGYVKGELIVLVGKGANALGGGQAAEDLVAVTGNGLLYAQSEHGDHAAASKAESLESQLQDKALFNKDLEGCMATYKGQKLFVGHFKKVTNATNYGVGVIMSPAAGAAVGACTNVASRFLDGHMEEMLGNCQSIWDKKGRLVSDDTPEFRRIRGRIAETWGLRVVTSDDGKATRLGLQIPEEKVATKPSDWLKEKFNALKDWVTGADLEAANKSQEEIQNIFSYSLGAASRAQHARRAGRMEEEK